MADCLQLQVILRGIAGFFACDCAGIVSCVCSYFCLRLAGIFTCDSSVFACRSRQFCMLVAGKFAWVPHVKLPVKYLWYSGKFTCARRQCACVPREVLAVSKQVNLPVITGKPHVTQVKRARDLFTCELHAKLPAFAGNFARASFTVWRRDFTCSPKNTVKTSKLTPKTFFFLIVGRISVSFSFICSSKTSSDKESKVNTDFGKITILEFSKIIH